MGKKYIIELEDKPFHKDGDFLYRVKGFNSLVFDMTGINKLILYTEPDLEHIRKEAYDKGYDDAKSGYDNGFENGMIVAWDAAKKIALMDTETSENVTGYFGLFRIMENLTPIQAIEKIRQYEQEKDRQARIEYNCEEIKDVLNTTMKECNVSLDEIAAVLQKMRDSK